MPTLPLTSPTPLAPTSDVEARLYTAIYDAIVERHLLPGAKLPEQQLSTLFGTTRSRVRAVLSRLAQEHYLELKPNRGAFVARPSPQEAREVFAARQVIEVAVVRQLSGKLRSAGREELRLHLEREASAAQRGEHREAVRLSGEFHLRLAELAGNSVLREVLGGLVVRSSLIIALYGGPTLHACADNEHATLLSAITSGDAAQAQALLSEHLSHIVASLDLSGRGERHLDLRQALRL